MLSQIHYPSGGTSQFVYEPNRYDNDQSDLVGNPASGMLHEGPGLRIRQIINDDGTGNKTIRFFRYGTNESGAGKILYVPTAGDFRQRFVTTFIQSSSAGTFILAGAAADNSFHTTFSSRPNTTIAEAYSFPVYYPEVAEYSYSSDLSLPKGKTVYRYSMPALQLFPLLTNNGVSSIVSYSPMSDAKLLDKSIYKFSNNQFILSSEDSYNYASYVEKVNPEIYIQRYISVANTGIDALSNSQANYPMDINYLRMISSPQSGLDLPMYYIASAGITSGAKRLVSETHSSIESGQTLTETKTYEYGNLSHLFPTKTTESNSKGSLVSTFLTYPLDYTGLSGTDGTSLGIGNLVGKHVIAPQIEKAIYQSKSDGTEKKLLSSIFNTYKPSVPYPSEVYSIDMSGPISDFELSHVRNGAIVKDSRYKLRLSFNQYDSYGNLLEQQKTNDKVVSYFWGYNYQYPVASVTGKSYNDVLALSSVNLSKVNNPSTTDIDLRTELNKFRQVPNTLVNTFTYIPLVGMTSSTDSKGETVFYEYDSIGRLSNIKDQSNTILKKIAYNDVNSYNYVPASVYTSSRSGNYTKSGCPTGQTGSVLTYVSGTYVSTVSQADADQQANSDLVRNGQLYANKNGSCTAIVGNVTLVGTVDNNLVTYMKVSFIQNNTTVVTASFPNAGDPPTTVSVPPGNYQLKFAFLPVDRNRYVPDFWIGTSANPHMQEWNGYPSSGNIITTGSVTISNGTRFEAGNGAFK